MGKFKLTTASAVMMVALSTMAQTPIYNYPGILGPGQTAAVSGPSEVFSGARTIPAWVDIPVNSQFYAQPIAVGGSSGSGDFSHVAGTGGENNGVAQYDLAIDHWGYGELSSTTPITPGTSEFVAMTYNGSGIVNFYINGVNAAFHSSYGGPISLYSYNLNTYTIGENTIGGSTTESTHLGDIADVSIYDSALTGAQIQSLYTSGVPDGGLTIAMLGTGISGLAFIRRKLYEQHNNI